MQAGVSVCLGGRLAEDVAFPHEVVVLENELDCSLVRAWREHLGLTQAVVAQRMGVSRPAYAQMEAKDSTPRVATLKRMAQAMGVEWEQLSVLRWLSPDSWAIQRKWSCRPWLGYGWS